MIDRSASFTILDAFAEFISLRASAAGTTPSSSRDGQPTDLFGQDLAPASRSRPRVSGRARTTNDTCGPRCSGSSASVALASSLASRLRQRLGTDGSMEYSQTWREKATPAGRSYWAHTASARRTSVSGCTGWPTATSRDHKDGHEQPNVPINGLLGRVAWLAGWGSPRAGETGSCRSEEAIAKAKEKGGSVALEDQVHLAGWASPKARDHKGNGVSVERKQRENWIRDSLDYQCKHGLATTSSPAETGSRAALNPAHSRWLQGYPAEWCQAAIRAWRKSKRQARPE